VFKVPVMRVPPYCSDEKAEDIVDEADVFFG